MARLGTMRQPRPVDATRIVSALQDVPRLHPGPGRWAVLRGSDIAMLAQGDGPPRWALATSASPVTEAVVLATGAGADLRAVVIDPDGALPDASLNELHAVGFELAAVHEPVAMIEVMTAASAVALASAVIAGDPVQSLPYHDPALWVILAWRVLQDEQEEKVAAARHWRVLAQAVVAREQYGFTQDWVSVSELIEACAHLGPDVLLARSGWGELSDDPRAGAVLLASPEFRASIGTLEVHAPAMLHVLTERAHGLAAATGMLTRS